MGRWIYIGAVDLHRGGGALHRGGGFTQGRWGGGAADLHRGVVALGGGRWIYPQATHLNARYSRQAESDQSCTDIIIT